MSEELSHIQLLKQSAETCLACADGIPAGKKVESKYRCGAKIPMGCTAEEAYSWRNEESPQWAFERKYYRLADKVSRPIGFDKIKVGTTLLRNVAARIGHSLVTEVFDGLVVFTVKGICQIAGLASLAKAGYEYSNGDGVWQSCEITE